MGRDTGAWSNASPEVVPLIVELEGRVQVAVVVEGGGDQLELVERGPVAAQPVLAVSASLEVVEGPFGRAPAGDTGHVVNAVGVGELSRPLRRRRPRDPHQGR